MFARSLVSRRTFSSVNLLQGTVQVTCTSNNTHAVFHDNFGKVIAKKSGGSLPRGANKKGGSLMALKIGEALGQELKEKSFKHVRVLYKGTGRGRGHVHRGLESSGISVIQIGEKNFVPHNGCRPPKKRRL